MLITHTPVDDGVLKVWHGLLVKSPNRIATPEDVTSARAYQEQSRLAFAQDFDIWAHKRPCRFPPTGRSTRVGSGTASSTTRAQVRPNFIAR